MWKRKEIKNKAKQDVKKNYWTAILVCFLLALLTSEFGTSIIGVWQEDDSMDPNYIIRNENIIMNDQIDNEQLEEAKEKSEEIEERRENLSDVQKKAWEAIENTANSAIKSYKYIFKVWDSIASFNLNQIVLGIGLSLAAVTSLAFTILVAEPLIVAGRRYFIKATEEENAKMEEMGEIFKKGSWINVTITMLLKNIYNLLWYLTIIGGIIKFYEYRMIPYILAEDPKVNRKEAFKLSKEMMKGNKWKTFILDLSFILWNILSVMTFGLLSILYLNPYKSMTFAELYKELKENKSNE